MRRRGALGVIGIVVSACAFASACAPAPDPTVEAVRPIVQPASLTAGGPIAVRSAAPTTAAATTTPASRTPTSTTTTGEAPDLAAIPPLPPPATDGFAVPAASVASDVAPTVPDDVLRTVTVAVAGDILPHSPLWRRAADNAAFAGRDGYDFTPMLSGLAPVVGAADLAICHLETPIAPEGEPLSTMPFYGVPAEVVDAVVAAGFDRCSTASNHALDRGTAGIDRTIEVLEAAGLGQSGMARTPEEIAPAVFEVDGVTISHLSYTYGYNGLRTPEGEPWRSALIDPLRIVEDSRAARALGAEVVIVSLHWGDEGEHEPSRFQRDVANWLTASGAADLIVGHHAHVVQPIEQVNGRWVIYGLGNVLSNLPTSDRWPAAAQDAMVVTVAVTVGADGAVTIAPPQVAPTWVDKGSGWVVRLVDDELALPDLPDDRRAALEASRARTAAVVGAHLP